MGEYDPYRERFKKHRIEKVIAQLALRATIWLATKKTGLDPKDPENFTGFIDGAILDYRLCHPNNDNDGLVYEQGDAGRMLGYDFNRPIEFPLSAFQEGGLLRSGKLFGFIIDEIKDNPRDQRTSIGQLNFFDIDHVLTIDSYNPEDLVDVGILDRVTYMQAYDYVGLASKYATDLRARSLDTTKVYQVSPKGNSLLDLVPDSGQATPKEDPQTDFNLIPGQLRGIRIT